MLVGQTMTFVFYAPVDKAQLNLSNFVFSSGAAFAETHATQRFRL